MQENNFLTIIKDIPELDSEYAIDVIGGSEELYKTMLMQFIRLLPSYIEDMDQALRTDSWGLFAIKAHGVKGSLRQIGKYQLAKCAEALEKAAKSDYPIYCHEHYNGFKDELLRFFAQLNTIFESIETDTEPANKPGGNIDDYKEILSQVRAALEDYDSLLAAELLAPLTKISFGGGTDALLAKAAEALELFQTQKALEYIIKSLFS